MKRSIAAALSVLLFACGGETAEDPGAPADTEPGVVDEETGGEEPPAWEGGALQIRLVDSIPWDTELAAGTYRRVAVRRDGIVDTLDEVAVESRPVVVGDSTIYGFDWSAGEVERGFRWSPETGVTGIDLPDDFLSFTAFALAPDAGHLAYAGRAGESADGEIRLAAIVRAWPEKDVTWESHRVAGYPSGGKNSTVEWFSADSVEVRIRLDDLETQGGSWLRATGSPSAGSFAADTVEGS